MTYSSASDVALYCPEIIGSGTVFSSETTPTRVAVEALMSQGYSIINTRLAARRYSTPVSESADVYLQLADLEALYAAARVQLAHMSSHIAARERSKGELLMERFWKDLGELLKGDLSLAGVGILGKGKMYAGGISKSDKQSYEGDTDRVEPRFQRDQFAHADRQSPAGGGISEED